MKPNMKPLELKLGESIIIKKKVKNVVNGDKNVSIMNRKIYSLDFIIF